MPALNAGGSLAVCAFFPFKSIFVYGFYFFLSEVVTGQAEVELGSLNV